MPAWMEAFEPLQSPPPVGWWPPAPGWWLLAAAGVILIGLGGWKAWRHRRRNRYRRALAQELDALWQRHQPDRNASNIEPYLSGSCELIRRTWRLLDPGYAALPTRKLLLELEQTPGVVIPPTLIHHLDQVLYGRLPPDCNGETLALSSFHHQLLVWSRKHPSEPSPTLRPSC